MKDIISATNNFDPTRVIGGGGFGKVYKGELSSPVGQITVAFKQLDRRFGQGNIEFWKEVMMLSKYKHENLISLMHFCIEGDEMILVYEYASRGSLDRYLSDASTLSWIQRLKICLGTARGLRFLHDPKGTQQRVLHRDIKSSNILLDENWTAKVSDFGLSKIGPANQMHTYLVSHGVGTPGYCDPLYMEFGFLSKESDVYSFGVVLFEILCGKLCYKYRNCQLTKILVPKWRRCYDEGRLDEIILPGLREQMGPSSLTSFSAIAYRCVKKVREERPMMAQIVEELEFSLEQQEIFEDKPESSRREMTSRVNNRFQDRVDDDYSQPPPVSEGGDSSDLEEDGPGIEGFEIIGDAKPGSKLLGCGFPLRGTSLCMFQWVRHFENGSCEYIEGATNPEYVVTADDVDKLIAVECIPMDDRGRQVHDMVNTFVSSMCTNHISIVINGIQVYNLPQKLLMLKLTDFQGEIVRVFANEKTKITCDPEMQQDIDNYMSAGQASFSALLLMDSPERWEHINFSLRRSKFQIEINHSEDIFIHEKYSSDLSIIIQPGLNVRIRHNYSLHTFSFHDLRMRDTFVLTMRRFKSKALDARS
ncbi:hypothetical protein SSX86_011983 [Deinandra increscens subsp. villosa]|uniref:Protein kinase domain-containing protein n=1 Tax=Deinandra increscens subsp. villosa TaxID=3103831 RepID=A0AAP0H128_9ASTR